MPGALPAPMSTLLGRSEELARLVEMLVTDRDRLVTITGLGGCGKTRLVLEAAWSVRPQFPDGVWFVDVSSVDDADGLTDELYRQLGIASLPGGDPLDRLCAVLSEKQALLVVDNCEQLVSAARVLGRVTSSCPAVSLVATSRRRLRLNGERLLPLSPLRLLNEGDDLKANAAVTLFCDRAAAVDPAFDPDVTDLRSVAEIVRRLDGLPLALELAAARSRSLPPPALLAALQRSSDQPWVVLDSAAVDAPARHRGLFEAVSWSVDLLTRHELVLFRRLGVFAGAWSIDDAQVVCSGPGSPPGAERQSEELLDPVSLLDALSTLVDLHLVEPVRETAIPSRYRMLDTIRAVARSMLTRSCEESGIRQRHAEHGLTVLLDAATGLESADEANWNRRVDVDTPDLHEAFRWLADHDRGTDVVRAAVALGPYWLNRGRFASGRRWLTWSASHGDGPDRAAARGWALRLALDGRVETMATSEAYAVIGELESLRGGLDPATHLRPWLRLSEHLSYAHRLYGDVSRAETVSLEAVEWCGSVELDWWRAEHVLRLALLAEQRGDSVVAREYAAEALTAAHSGGNARVKARALQARLLSTPGLPAEDITRGLGEVLSLSEQFGDRRGAVTTRVLLAAFAWEAGDRAASGREYLRSIAESVEIGYQHGAGFAAVALVMQDAQTAGMAAALLHGAMLPLLPTIRRQMPTAYVSAYDALLHSARQTTGPAAFDAEVARGTTLNWDATVALARSRADLFVQQPVPTTDVASTTAPATPGVPKPEIESAEPLSGRELEVIRLIAAGHTNEQIARRLYLSPKTVMHHSGHIYRKLGVRGRAEAVARASRTGLLD